MQEGGHPTVQKRGQSAHEEIDLEAVQAQTHAGVRLAEQMFKQMSDKGVLDAHDGNTVHSDWSSWHALIEATGRGGGGVRGGGGGGVGEGGSGWDGGGINGDSGGGGGGCADGVGGGCRDGSGGSNSVDT